MSDLERGGFVGAQTRLDRDEQAVGKTQQRVPMGVGILKTLGEAEDAERMPRSRGDSGSHRAELYRLGTSASRLVPSDPGLDHVDHAGNTGLG